MAASIETFGDFTLVKELGKGAFGSVYLAQHRFTKQEYVLKILPENLSNDPEFIEKFEKNIGTIARLNHPSIVKVHNVSAFDGKYFLVMDKVIDLEKEYVTLDAYLQSKNFDLAEKEVETILSQLASALDYAHQFPFEEGYLFHGGIKLTNILINQTDKNLRAYLSDFGLNRFIGEKTIFSELAGKMAEALSDSESEEKTLQSYLSNFAFLAPEQKIYANREKCDAKVDTYAFGVLVYYLIAGGFPEGFFEMPAKIKPEFEQNWDELIKVLLQSNPSKRPLHLTKALDKYLSTTTDSWSELEQAVESKMQLSFPFPKDKDKSEAEVPFKPTEESPDLKPVLKPQEIERPVYEPDPGAIFQREMQVSRYEPKKVEISEVDPILTEMVIIPGGTYSRGCQNGARDEMPRHSITVNSYAIDIHPVTNEQFVRFLQAMGGEKDGNNNDIIRLRDSRIKRSGGKL
ncbi:MAG: protein kinase, partial [Chlamydiota bacterium]